MYLACKIFILRSIWTSLVLSLVGPAVSDTSIFANDLYPSDVESDAVPGDDGGNFIMGQFSNSVAPGDNLLADNLLVQSCVSPSSKLRARGQECGSDSADESSDVLNDKIFLTGQDLQDLNDEMLSTDHEVQKYWCEDLLQFGLYLPVCSLDPGAQESYTLLQSTLSQSSFFFFALHE